MPTHMSGSDISMRSRAPSEGGNNRTSRSWEGKGRNPQWPWNRPGPSLNEAQMQHQKKKSLFVQSNKDSDHHVPFACQPLTIRHKKENSRHGIEPGEEQITAARFVSSAQQRRHHSSAHITGVVCPRPSCRCLCCVLSLRAELATVCVIDTRRHGEAACDISAAVSFMQLHRRRQDTSNHAHRCHRRVCVCGSPKGSAARRCSETQHRVEGHPTSITVDVISTEGAQVYCAGRVLVYWKSVALDASTPMLLFHTRPELKQSHRQKNASRNRLCGNNRARPGGYFSLFQNLQTGSPEKKNCCSLFTRDCGSQAVLSCSYRM